MQDLIEKLTPEQKNQLAEEMGLPALIAQWRAEDVLNEAKKRYESTNSRLNSEQAKFDQIEAAERQRFEARLATFKQGLDTAAAEHVGSTAALRDAEASLAAINDCSADSAR